MIRCNLTNRDAKRDTRYNMSECRVSLSMYTDMKLLLHDNLGLNSIAQSVTHRLMCFLKPCAKLHLELMLYTAVFCRLTWVSMACVCALKLMV